MDTDRFVLSVSTKDDIKDLKNLEDIHDFSNLDKTVNSSVIKKSLGEIQNGNS